MAPTGPRPPPLPSPSLLPTRDIPGEVTDDRSGPDLRGAWTAATRRIRSGTAEATDAVVAGIRAALEQADRPEVLRILAAAALVATWIAPDWWVPAGAFALLLALLAVRERTPRDRRLTAGAFVLWSAAWGTWALADALGYGPWRVGFEAALAPLVATVGSLFALTVHRALADHAGSVMSSPYVAVGLFALGAVTRWLELSTVAGESSARLFDLLLRYDVAEILWGLASALLLLHQLWARVAPRIAGWGPATKTQATALLVGLAVLTQAVFTMAAVAVTTARGRPDVVVGAHVDDVGHLPEAADSAHLEVRWSDVQPQPDVWNFVAYDRQLDRLEADGRDALLLVGMSAPPGWLITRHRDAIMRDRDGQVFHWFDTAPGRARDRIHDLSYTDPEVNAARDELLRRVVERYGDRPGVAAVAVMNEPAYPTDLNPLRIGSYDNATVDAFRDHLRERYGNATALNRAVGINASSLETVEPPPSLTGPFGEVWQRFRERTIVDHVRRAMTVARNHTDKPVTVKIMAHYLVRYATARTGLTHEVVGDLVEMSDVVAPDLYPLTQNDLRRSLEYFRSLAGRKPIWVAEFNYAAGPNLPTMGSRIYQTLALIGRYADRVYFFTAEDHFLYGLQLYGSRPGLVAIQLYQTPPTDAAFVETNARLVASEIGAVANIYSIYATGSAFMEVPVVPWQVIVLVALPWPRVAGLEDRRALVVRLGGAGGAWVVLWLVGGYLG